MKEKIELLNHYEINCHTLAIIPFPASDGEIYSKIYEGDHYFICKLSPIKIIKRSCDYFGCSYEGKKKGTQALMKYTHKLPVSIDAYNTIYFFPTHSPSNPACMWFSFHNILDRFEEDYSKTTVIFRNKERLSVQVSLHSFNNQLLRTSSLQTKINHNQENALHQTKIMYKEPDSHLKRLAEKKHHYYNDYKNDLRFF